MTPWLRRRAGERTRGKESGGDHRLGEAGEARHAGRAASSLPSLLSGAPDAGHGPSGCTHHSGSLRVQATGRGRAHRAAPGVCTEEPGPGLWLQAAEALSTRPPGRRARPLGSTRLPFTHRIPEPRLRPSAILALGGRGGTGGRLSPPGRTDGKPFNRHSCDRAGTRPTGRGPGHPRQAG